MPPQPWQRMIVGSRLPSSDLSENTSAAMRVPSLMMLAVAEVDVVRRLERRGSGRGLRPGLLARAGLPRRTSRADTMREFGMMRSLSSVSLQELGPVRSEFIERSGFLERLIPLCDRPFDPIGGIDGEV